MVETETKQYDESHIQDSRADSHRVSFLGQMHWLQQKTLELTSARVYACHLINLYEIFKG